ncbi:MAG: SEL1-like repeat protein, partial [Planctomycetes bacterium]|nr:SEL1-like repeat protein [Planctomycetota bacterium]
LQKGIGAEQGFDGAIKLYEEASAKGYAPAQNQLAKFDLEGQGVTKDGDKAVELFRKSAEQEFGGLAGRVLLAFLVVVIVSRRASDPHVPGAGSGRDAGRLRLCRDDEHQLSLRRLLLCWTIDGRAIQLLGQLLAPRVYPLHLRGTGQSFAANIGGRMLGTFFAWITATVAVQDFVPGESPAVKLAYTAAVVGFTVYLVGFIASFWLPEPETEELPE